MTTRQVLSIAIDTLEAKKKTSPNAEVKFATETGTQTISIDAAMAQLENLYHWCYDPFDLNDLEKICRCKDCVFYKKYRKKNAPKRVYKMLCSIDKTAKPEGWYCPKGMKEDHNESANEQSASSFDAQSKRRAKT